MSKPRYTASTITDEALDALYENANHGWRRGDAWKERALKAEAALIRAHEWADDLDALARRAHTDAAHPVAASLRARMDYDPREESTTP